jgi:geranylgeranyl diphosphate synthase type II
MAGEFEITEYMKSLRSEVDDALIAMLQPIRDWVPERLYEAMVYSLVAGGKRIRPILLISSYSMYDSEWRKSIPYAAAVEYVHTYSLIHDDLPAMDDDDFRRGIPTCHKVFGEALAILAGDALLTEAFRIFSETRDDGISLENKVRATWELAKAAGAAGMVGGQVLDMQFASTGANEKAVKEIHRKKTAALIGASVLCGAILSGAGKEDLSVLTRFGSNLGLAFQIVDDILDVKSSFSEMGKKTGKDAEIGKATYPSAVGLKSAEAEAAHLIDEAINCLKVLGELAAPLEGIAELCLRRRS